MRILLTGANGYVGRRLLPELLSKGHEVICCIRDKNRLGLDKSTLEKITIWEVDFLHPIDLNNLPEKIDVAYYLIHSMTSSTSDFDVMEGKSARNFNLYMNEIGVTQVVYLSGIVNNSELSKHLQSRKNVEDILFEGHFKTTVLRAGIIVGSGSSSFEIIRDLCEKLPVMVTPKWVLTKCQPIAIRDVIHYLTGVLLQEEHYNRSYDIGGPNVITYKEMMLLYSKTRGIKLWIFTLPVMSPKLSSYWLYFVTSTSYKLATALVSSMKVEVICSDNRINDLLQVTPMTYEQALSRALIKINKDDIPSSWKDAMISGRFKGSLMDYRKVPKKDCFIDRRKMEIENRDFTIERIWSIGGETGWYYGDC